MATKAEYTWVNPDVESRLSHAKVSVAHIKSGSKTLGVATNAIETPTTFELWEKELRVAGVTITKAETQAGIRLGSQTILTGGIGAETRTDDTKVDTPSRTTPTAKVGIVTELDSGIKIGAGIQASNTETRLTMGAEASYSNGFSIGAQAYTSRGRNG